MIPLAVEGPDHAARTIVLAHGAGAPMDSPFLDHFARGLAARGLRVVRFEFPYMQARRNGRRLPPDRPPVLSDCWREVVSTLGGARQLVIGGKSLGGRIASLVSDEVSTGGLVCLGYPFHPPGKPQVLRVEHLRTLATPIRVHWITDGDHSLKPRARSGRTEKQNLAEALEAIAEFVAGLSW